MVVDRTTRWLEAFPLQNITAVACADTFTAGWVARFGVLHTITTARGTQFTGALWASLCGTLNIQHITKTAFHPQSNGVVERFHQQLKDGLRARCGERLAGALTMGAFRALGRAQRGLSNLISRSGVRGPHFPAGPVSGSCGTPPPPACQLDVILLRERSYVDVASGCSILDAARFVQVCSSGSQAGPLGVQYAGPYEVLRCSRKDFELRIGDKLETVASDRLKLHSGADPVPAQPPRHGRPPGSGGVGSLGSGLEGAPVDAARNL